MIGLTTDFGLNILNINHSIKIYSSEHGPISKKQPSETG